MSMPRSLARTLAKLKAKQPVTTDSGKERFAALRAALKIPESVRIFGPWSGKLRHSGNRILREHRGQAPYGVVRVVRRRFHGERELAQVDDGLVFFLDDNLLANRELRGVTVLLSVMATQASAITFLSTPGQGFADGLRFVQFYFGLPFAMVVLCLTVSLLLAARAAAWWSASAAGSPRTRPANWSVGCVPTPSTSPWCRPPAR